MPQYAPDITLLPRQRSVLEHLVRSSTTPQRVAERARIILRSEAGELCVHQAASLGVDAQRVRRWRRRWAAAMDMLASAEAQDEVDDLEFEAVILGVLNDEYRCGVPPKFSAEQLAQIISLACQEPSTLGLPVTHWTPRELAIEAKRQGIVDDISPRHLGRFLKRGGDSAAPLKVLAQPKDR